MYLYGVQTLWQVQAKSSLLVTAWAGALRQGHGIMILRRLNQSSKVVLVVEDNPDDIALVQIGARNAECPFTFKFVGNGEDALAYLEGAGQFVDRRHHPMPDLIVLDLNMPRRNGFEVLKWIRTRLQFEKIQIIVWTGWDHADTADRVRQAGANLFLRKPEEASGWITFIGMVSLALNGLQPHAASRARERRPNERIAVRATLGAGQT
jgi:CheY-like chemotaxis protein